MLKNVKEFGIYLVKKGLDSESEAYENEMNRYQALLLEKRPIINIDEQARVLVGAIQPLAEKASLIILVSGQHLNKSNPYRDRDEASELELVLEGVVRKSTRIKAIPGGDSGAGYV